MLHLVMQVEIVKADQDVYGAIIDNKVAVKLGPGWWEPNTSEFEKVIDGNDYTVHSPLHHLYSVPTKNRRDCVEYAEINCSYLIIL